jgi:HEAT repeat protein
VRTSLVTSLLSVLVIALSSLEAQTVSKYAGDDTTLDERWKWASQRASALDDAKECWIGYRIQRLMDDDAFILSGNIFSGTLERRNSLYTLISGQKSEEANSTRELRSRGESKIFKRMKDVALLFFVSRNSSGSPVTKKLDECTMELSFNLKGKPLFWLGTFGDDESIRRLKKVFAEATTVELKKELVEAIGIHQHSNDVFPFLSNLLTGKESDDVRAKAAFWMGEQDHPEGLKVLVDGAEKDRSLKVREETVFAISRLDSDESTDALISLARKADNPKVRGKAAFWLGQKASQKVVATLENIIADDEETEVQRQALFALSQIKDTEGVERLIRIARSHPNPRIRKQAIQILGQSDNSKALEALIEIVRK